MNALIDSGNVAISTGSTDRLNLCIHIFASDKQKWMAFVALYNLRWVNLGVKALKDKQKEAIYNFVRGQDCFVILPTGYGKTLCYALLPFVFDHLRKRTPRSSIVVCVSPLVSLMMDQVGKYMTKGLATQFVGEAQGDLSDISRVLEGEYQLVTP